MVRERLMACCAGTNTATTWWERLTGEVGSLAPATAPPPSDPAPPRYRWRYYDSPPPGVSFDDWWAELGKFTDGVFSLAIAAARPRFVCPRRQRSRLEDFDIDPKTQVAWCRQCYPPSARNPQAQKGPRRRGK
jgi:hypothetical protein